MCWQKIKRYFKKKPEKPEKVDLAELRWKSPQWFKRIFRLVKTSRGGPNMPKFQPCPFCYGKAKRTDKPEGGANYRCRRHGLDEPSFFVRAP